jgi:hypothetical protein
MVPKCSSLIMDGEYLLKERRAGERRKERNKGEMGLR